MCLVTCLKDVLVDSAKKKAVLNAKMATSRMVKFVQSVMNSSMGATSVLTHTPALNAPVTF